MAIDDPIIKRLQDQIDALQAQLNRLQNNSVRSEVTGAFVRKDFADLPAAGIPGRVFWVLDIGDGLLYLDNGSAWVPLTPSATDTPTVNPGWSTSATVNMTPPDVYIGVYVNGNTYVVPGWLT